MDKHPRLKDSIITSAESKSKSDHRGFIIIFLIIFVLLLTLIGRLATYYKEIETAYSDYIFSDYQNVYARQDEDTYYLLSLYSSLLTDQGIESNQFLWGQLWQVDQSSKTAKRLLIPLNLQMMDKGKSLSFKEMIDQEAYSIPKFFNEYFDIPINYLAIHRLDYLRPIVEAIEPIKANNDFAAKIDADIPDSLTSHAINQLIKNLEIQRQLPSYYQQEAIIDMVFGHIFSNEQLLKLPEIIEKGQLFIDSNLRPRQWIDWQLQSFSIEDYRLEDNLRLDYNQEVETYQLNIEDFESIIRDFQSLSN